MKIAQINSVYNQGSTGRIVSDIHNFLTEKGHQSMVFYGRGPEYEDKNVIKISDSFSVFKDVLYTRLFNKHSESDTRNTINLISELKKFSPDIIHLHNIHGYYLNFSILFDFLKDFHKPIIWLLHDQWSFSGGTATFDSTKIDWSNPDEKSVKESSKSYPKYLYFNTKSASRNYSLKEEKFIMDNLSIVTPSLWLKKEVEQSFLHRNSIFTIYNGIDNSKFKFVPTKSANNNYINLLFVASVWNVEKGIEFIGRLTDDLPENYNFTLVGKCDKKYLNMLSKRVKFIPKTDSIDELVEYYSNADALINPTLFDNFPSVNIEAQSCGTPVITFNSGGSGESITEYTGKVIERENYLQLLNACLELNKKNDFIIQNCIKNASKYSKENMIQNYINLYESKI